MRKNEESIFLQDIEVPRIVQEKADEAFFKIKRKEMDIMSKKENTDSNKSYKVRKLVKPIIAIAACAVLALTASVGRNAGSAKNDITPTVNHDESDLQKEDKFNLSFPEFSITAYAAELNIEETREGNLIFADIGISDNGYTGIMFNIQGEEISNVDILIDKGELYSATIEYTTEEALHEWMAQGMPDLDHSIDTYTIVETVESEQEDIKEQEDINLQNVKLYHCTKRGTEINEAYASETYYGLYIPDSALPAMSNETDLAEASHNMLRIFDDAVLSVTVTYSDGSRFTKKYELSAAKLIQDEHGTITQEEWKGGDEGRFIYGIIAKEKK